LLVNGSPVSQATVIAVLEVLYSNMWALGFEAPSRKGQQSVTHLLNMLLFADAVGCSKQALSQLAGLIGRFRLEVCVPADRGSNNAAAGTASAGSAPADSIIVKLQLHGMYKFAECDDGSTVLVRLQAAYSTTGTSQQHPRYSSCISSCRSSWRRCCSQASSWTCSSCCSPRCASCEQTQQTCCVRL
jgi:hypothetical protein